MSMDKCYVNTAGITNALLMEKGTIRPLTTLFTLEAPYPHLEAAAGARCLMRFHTFSLNTSTRKGFTK